MNVTMGQYADPNGQMYSQLGSGIGGAVGMLGGPVGSAIGGAAGGALGGLLGGGKKKRQVKIFPIGTKENPGWPGFGSQPGTLDMGAPPPEGPSALGQAISGGMNGFLNNAGGGMGGGGGAMSQMFGGQMPTSFRSSPLGHLFGMGQDTMMGGTTGAPTMGGTPLPTPYSFGPGMTL